MTRQYQTKELNKAIRDTLAFNNWTVYQNGKSYAKSGVVLTIYPARNMKAMYHVGVDNQTESYNRFLHIEELTQLIERIS